VAAPQESILNCNRVIIMLMRFSQIQTEMKSMALKIIPVLEKQSRFFWVITGAALLCLVGITDYLTGFEVSFSLFYLIPIALVTWFTTYKLGMMFAVASAIVWLLADMVSGAVYSYQIIYIWNSAVRLGFFAIAVFSLELIKTLEREKTFARMDYVTGTLNTRYFHALAQREIDRSSRYRHPFTIAYIDVDNFKIVNDSFGHITGDKVLYAVADCMQRHLRKTDIVARVGGDEFAILLPEVELNLAKAVISKMRRKLLDDMQKNNWSVTFSIGVLTFLDAPPSVDEMLNMVDKLMYSVKNRGKDAITFATYTGQQALAAE
jgi:diguanylate cyclase (GGDEF)-like protein